MNQLNPDDVRALLSYDALAEAERATGKSYKTDEITMAVGMLTHMSHNEKKNAVLTSIGDTTYNSDFATQMAAFSDLGFKVVLEESFDGESYDGSKRDETYAVLWHPDGVLGTCESHMTTGRNTANIHYNLRLDDTTEGWPSYLSSGRNRDGVWIGHHDVREAMKFKFTQLAENGTFLNPWVEQPFLWLLNYVESNGKNNYQAINQERINQLPSDIRNAITPS